MKIILTNNRKASLKLSILVFFHLYVKFNTYKKYKFYDENDIKNLIPYTC